MSIRTAREDAPIVYYRICDNWFFCGKLPFELTGFNVNTVNVLVAGSDDHACTRCGRCGVDLSIRFVFPKLLSFLVQSKERTFGVRAQNDVIMHHYTGAYVAVVLIIPKHCDILEPIIYRVRWPGKF